MRSRLFKCIDKYCLRTTVPSEVDFMEYKNNRMTVIYKDGSREKSDYSWVEFRDKKFREKNIGHYEEV